MPTPWLVRDLQLMEVLLKLHVRVSLVFPVVLLAADFLSLPSARAQLAGHYIGGATGLEDGSTAPPGFYATFFPVVERVDTLKGPAGATIARPNINVVANLAAYAVTTQKKILGAQYGLSVIFPIVNTRFTETSSMPPLNRQVYQISISRPLCSAGKKAI
jgi:hypothetical protein